MNGSRIQVVSFDAAGTLIHLAEPVGKTYARVAASHGVEVDSTSLGRAFTSVWRRTPPPFVDPAARDADERDWWRRLVRAVFAEAGAGFPNDGTYLAFFDELYDRFEEPGTWLPDPDAARVLETVARAHRCIVLSNFDRRLRRILADLNLLDFFETLFLSGEQGLSKPDPRLFRRVSETLGVPPQEILHVGDDPECDWSAANASGFRHFRVGGGVGTLAALLEELSLAGS